ncbi:MAG: hypothetical protein II881_09375 [Oscillospiraceae bacterium]|nr:hypothetical protein [Oscillospiraceae bacterium]
MGKNYVLNPQNGKIHIIGYCHFTNPHPKEWKAFFTEEDARAFFGNQSAGLCKYCLNKREEKLGKEKNTQ